MEDNSHEAVKLRHLLDEWLKLWNKGDYDKLAEVFDADIIIKKLDDPGSVSGIGNVLTYLNKNQKTKRPQFTIEHAEPVYVWDSGTLAQISGTGIYRDRTDEHAKERDKSPLPVHFTFTFSRDGKDHDWLVVNAFQARRIVE